MKFGYTRGYADGYAAAKDAYERQIALLAEQVSDARAFAAAAVARADATFDQLAIRLGAQPVSAPALQLRHEAVRANMDRHGVVQEDAFEELELGAAGSAYQNAEAAMLSAA